MCHHVGTNKGVDQLNHQVQCTQLLWLAWWSRSICPLPTLFCVLEGTACHAHVESKCTLLDSVQEMGIDFYGDWSNALATAYNPGEWFLPSLHYKQSQTICHFDLGIFFGCGGKLLESPASVQFVSGILETGG